jgi:hypothetical protein
LGSIWRIKRRTVFRFVGDEDVRMQQRVGKGRKFFSPFTAAHKKARHFAGL